LLLQACHLHADVLLPQGELTILLLTEEGMFIDALDSQHILLSGETNGWAFVVILVQQFFDEWRNGSLSIGCTT
jgi:hypothetical protein